MEWRARVWTSSRLEDRIRTSRYLDMRACPCLKRSSLEGTLKPRRYCQQNSGLSGSYKRRVPSRENAAYEVTVEDRVGHEEAQTRIADMPRQTIAVFHLHLLPDIGSRDRRMSALYRPCPQKYKSHHFFCSAGAFDAGPKRVRGGARGRQSGRPSGSGRHGPRSPPNGFTVRSRE